jgi:hypothetical protein
MQPSLAGTGRPPADLDVERVTSDSLTASEQRLQGRWQAYAYGASTKSYEMSFAQRRFRAEGAAGEWYAGRVDIRDEGEPSELDLFIEDCSCKFKGMTSRAIFRWEGEDLVMAAPEPGAARPLVFDESSGQMLELRRDADSGRAPAQD